MGIPIAPLLLASLMLRDMLIAMNSNLKDVVHSSYVLNYIMWKLDFWKMCIYTPKDKLDCYKIRLYRPMHGGLRKSSFMAFDAKSKSHAYVSDDHRLKDVVGIDIHFAGQQYDYSIAFAKSLFLDIIKDVKMFKWKNDEFFTPSYKGPSLDELLVKADLEQDSFQANEEAYVLSHIERMQAIEKCIMPNSFPFG